MVFLGYSPQHVADRCDPRDVVRERGQDAAVGGGAQGKTADPLRSMVVPFVFAIDGARLVDYGDPCRRSP